MNVSTYKSSRCSFAATGSRSLSRVSNACSGFNSVKPSTLTLAIHKAKSIPKVTPKWGLKAKNGELTVATVNYGGPKKENGGCSLHYGGSTVGGGLFPL